MSPGQDETERSRGSRLNRANAALALIMLLGFAWRLWYISAHEVEPVTGDGIGYHYAANALADGHGFVSPLMYVVTSGEVEVPVADHPPLWTVVLGFASLVGVDSLYGHQIVAVLIGTATVGMVGLAGRAVGGGRVGLIAAAVAAVYPNLWMYERVLLSETLAIFLTAVMICVAYRFRSRPTRWGVLAVGFVTGLLALTRAEAILLVLLLVAPLVWFCSVHDRRTRAIWLGLAVTTTVVTIAPWTIYNSNRFQHPVLLTTSLGQTLAAANCDEAYAGAQIGFWNYDCLVEAKDEAGRDGGDPSSEDLAMRRRAADYALDHMGRVPLVVLARQGRTWGLYEPTAQTQLETIGGPTRRPLAWGLWAYWFLASAAIGGAVLLRRRGAALYPLLGFAITVALATGLTFGQIRYRGLAEVPIVVLAAVALDAGATLVALRVRRAGSLPASRQPDEAVVQPSGSLA